MAKKKVNIFKKAEAPKVEENPSVISKTTKIGGEVVKQIKDEAEAEE